MNERSCVRRRNNPAWVNDPRMPVLISLPETLHQVRDELVSGLKEQVTFYRALTIGLLIIVAVLTFLL